MAVTYSKWSDRFLVPGELGPVITVGGTVAACAILRPLRDDQAVSCGPEAVAGLFVATLAALLIVTAVIAAAQGVARRPSGVSASITAGVAAVALVLAWIVTGKAGPSYGGALFIVSHGVFSVLSVAMSWQSLKDRSEESRRSRLVAAAAIGAGIGSIAGPLTASLLTSCAGPRSLVPAAAIFLALATLSGSPRQYLGMPCHRIPLSRTRLATSNPAARVREVALLVGGWSAVSTVIYFVQVSVAGEQLSHSHARVEWFAALDLASNAVALLVQLGTAHLTTRRRGLPAVLAIGPTLAACGFVAIWAWPDVGVLAVVTVIGRAGGTALFRPARELLLATADSSVGSHTRCAIDGIVYRAADAATAASIGVVSGGAPSVGALAGLGATAALGLAVAGYRIGRNYEHGSDRTSQAVAPHFCEAAYRKRIDSGMPGCSRCVGSDDEHPTNSIDRRARTDRRTGHVADLRRRPAKPDGNPRGLPEVSAAGRSAD